jgi:L-ribulokinase
VINGGGIPQNNTVLNHIYANVLNKPVLVPDGTPTSLGSGIIALAAAGVFPSIAAAQEKLCLPFKTYLPDPDAAAIYEQLYQLYRKVYFAFGSRNSSAVPLGEVLPELRRIASLARSA